MALKEILVRDDDGNLTNQIKDEFLDDHLGVSEDFLVELLYQGRCGRGGGSANRRANPAFRILYPHKSDHDNWVQSKALSGLARIAVEYEHLVEKAAMLKKNFGVAAMFELLFDKAKCVLEAWSPDGLDLASVDWNDSTSIAIDRKREWLALVLPRLGLCCGREPLFQDLSGSRSPSVRAEEASRVNDAIASEILADRSRIMEDLRFREEKVRLKCYPVCLIRLQHQHTHLSMSIEQEERMDRNRRMFHAALRDPKVREVARFLDQHRVKAGRTRTYDQFATELSTKFEELVSRGLSQFRFDDIRQFLILTKEQYNDSKSPKHFGKLIRYFVVLVAGQCCDCMRPVRGIFSEASGFFEINHVIRGLADYVKPSDDAAANGCVMLMDHILDHYNGEVDCKNCHKKDEHAHEQRGQNHPQAGVCLLCSDLREPLGSARTPILSPTVSSGYDHDVSDFDDT